MEQFISESDMLNVPMKFRLQADSNIFFDCKMLHMIFCVFAKIIVIDCTFEPMSHHLDRVAMMATTPFHKFAAWDLMDRRRQTMFIQKNLQSMHPGTQSHLLSWICFLSARNCLQNIDTLQMTVACVLEKINYPCTKPTNSSVIRTCSTIATDQ